jgi:VanZ family protein
MKDSIKHFLVSTVGTIIFSVISFLFLDKELAVYLGGLIMFLIGVSKEVVWDWLMKRGVPSLADITMDAMGVFTAMFIMLMFIY